MSSKTVQVMKESKTALWQAALLVLFGLFLSLMTAEAAARILYKPEAPGPQRTYKTEIHETVSDLNLLYKLSPGAETIRSGTIHKINSAGFRDREFSFEKTPGTERILFLGDSVVYGYEVGLEKSLPKMLEKNLLEKGKKAEVLNFGVLGYETSQNLKRFKTLGKKFNPDIVILGYTLNDSRFASFEFSKFGEKNKWHVPSPQLHWHERLPHFFYRHMKLLQYLDKEKHLFDPYENACFYLRGEKDIWHHVRDQNIVNQDKADSPYRRLRPEIEKEAARLKTNPDNVREMLEFAGYTDNLMFTSHWNVSKKAVAEMKKLSEEQGFELRVVIFPYLWCLDNYPLLPLHRFLMKEFSDMGVTAFDSFEVMRENFGGKEEQITFDGVHLTAAGAAAIADYLAENLSI